MKKKSPFLTLITASFLLPFMLFVVSPLSFYFSNVNEVNFTLTDVFLPVLAILIVSSLIFFLLQILIVKIKFVYPVFSGLLLGFALCVWIQSQLMAWDFGPLDGRGVEWSRWSNHAAIECLVWFLMIAVCIYIALFKKKMMSGLLSFCLVIGIGSCVLSYINSPAKNSERTGGSSTQWNNVFHFHPQNNVIVILLDTFQSDYFELISKEHPDEVNFLEGFTFYRNTISQYPTTCPSIPAIMTGQIYENLEPFVDYERKAYANFSLVKAFGDKGYASSYFGPQNFQSVLEKYSFSTEPFWSYFTDYGLFRSLPIIGKKHVYNNGQWFISYYLRGKYPPDHHGRDVKLLELLEKKASIKDDNKGCFRFFHFYTPHLPLLLDEQLHYKTKLSGSEGYESQARGALKIAQRIIEKLHELGIYDSSEIVIMADHGTYSMPPLQRSNDSLNDMFSDIPLRVRSSALALMLHKKPWARGRLVVNDTPLYVHDLMCILGVKGWKNKCSEFNPATKEGHRKRRFLFYDWKHEHWQKAYMPPITEYFIDGHAYDINSWHEGRFRYDAGKKFELSSGMNTLEIEQSIKFTADGNSGFLIRGGWSGQEATHRWTDGSQAGLLFRLKKQPDTNLLFRLKASAYLGGGLPYQTIDVVVNGQKTTTWQMKGLDWYEAVIPSRLVSKNGILEVLFNISNPTSPAEVGESKDARKLGIAAREMIMVEKGKR